MKGNSSVFGEFSCFFKLNKKRQIYQQETGICKIPAETEDGKPTVSENKTPNEEAKTAIQCQRACEENLIKCWAF